ncbi:uncharacterized protein LOC128156369 [Crassostrea angulata]|nr:uncharacterized protein LOC128156369 [Crassostrea angulata]
MFLFLQSNFTSQNIRAVRTDIMYLQCTVVYFLVCVVAFSGAEILIRGTETARVGSQARLQCIARDYDNQPRKISWFHNGRLVLKSSRNTITELFNENKNGYTLSELQIPEVRKGDAGRYVCKTDKKHQASLYLTVN